MARAMPAPAARAFGGLAIFPSRTDPVMAMENPKTSKIAFKVPSADLVKRVLDENRAEREEALKRLDQQLVVNEETLQVRFRL